MHELKLKDAIDPSCAQRYQQRKIRVAQRSSVPLIDPRAFAPIVPALGGEYKTDLFWTREAIAALQAATEDPT